MIWKGYNSALQETTKHISKETATSNVCELWQCHAFASTLIFAISLIVAILPSVLCCHYGFNVYVPDVSLVRTVSCLFGHSYICLVKCQGLLPIFHWLVYILTTVEVSEFFIYPECKFFIRYILCEYFSQTVACLFFFCSSDVQDLFLLMKSSLSIFFFYGSYFLCPKKYLPIPKPGR